MNRDRTRAILALRDGVNDDYVRTAVLVECEREHKAGWASAHDENLCRVGQRH